MGDRTTTAFSKERLLTVLRGGGAGEVPKNRDDPYVRAIRGGEVTAPLVGGCLWLLMQTIGTPGRSSSTVRSSSSRTTTCRPTTWTAL